MKEWINGSRWQPLEIQQIMTKKGPVFIGDLVAVDFACWKGSSNKAMILGFCWDAVRNPTTSRYRETVAVLLTCATHEVYHYPADLINAAKPRKKKF